MENILIFLRHNWKFLVEIFVPLVSLVVLCLVKKTKINIPESAINVMWSMIPDWVSDAEKFYGDGHGDEKLKMVVKTACDYVSTETNVPIKRIAGLFADAIIEQVEKVLSTPKKKEKD